jgi:hypothetical protein
MRTSLEEYCTIVFRYRPLLARFVIATSAAALSALSMAQAAIVVPNRVPPAVAASIGFGSVVGKLHHVVTIGSTVDPKNGDQNPYGLAIAPTTAGMIKAGDLIISNFNDSANIQGLGTTLEVLHPTPGSKPISLISDPHLTGSAAVAMPPGSFPWVASYTANDNPIVTPSGQLATSLNTFGWTGPWGQAFSPTAGPRGTSAFYESNAYDGSIVRINVTKRGTFTFDTIATGFSVNHGVPGNILAPAGLTYDSTSDVLYIVDSNANRVVAFQQPGKIPANGIVVTSTGFGGPAGSMAHVVFAGKPLQAPISAALLFNGNLVVGNTTNNKLIELTPSGHAVNERLLDTGAKGALFGIVATGTSISTTKIYFNDDNDNMVKVLQP